MSFEEYKNLWVFVETEENEVKPVGYELLNPGRELADKMGAKLVAVVIGGKVEDIAKKAITVADDQIKLRIKETVKEIAESVNLEEAEVIVAGGRGMGSKENFDKLQELADILGGVVGCTRPAMESGWISRAHQVGQSGKIVAPKVYFAFGISGATQHVSGMIGSGYIVAVNKDEDAPIFDVADVGIVGGAMDVLDIMIEEFKKNK